MECNSFHSSQCQVLKDAAGFEASHDTSDTGPLRMHLRHQVMKIKCNKTALYFETSHGNTVRFPAEVECIPTEPDGQPARPGQSLHFISFETDPTSTLYVSYRHLCDIPEFL